MTVVATHPSLVSQPLIVNSPLIFELAASSIISAIHRHSHDTVDDSAPLQRLDRIDRCRIDENAHHCRHHDGRVERLRFLELSRKANWPLTGFANGVGCRAGKDRNSQKSRAENAHANVVAA